MKTYDVVYAVTRSETYRVKAVSKHAAAYLAFSSGKLVDEGNGETTGCETLEVKQVRK